MRKQDIRAGVAYAYQGSMPRNIEPCVLVSTELHTGRNKYLVGGGPWCAPALPGTRPGRDHLNGNTGYPALLRSSGISAPRKPDAAVIALMLSVTPDVLAAGDVPPGLKLTILTSLTPLKGEWATVKADHDAQQQRAREDREARQAEARTLSRRAQAVRESLLGHGITASWNSSLVSLTLDDAERLAGLLDAEG
jgi:hypothetical protein